MDSQLEEMTSMSKKLDLIVQMQISLNKKMEQQSESGWGQNKKDDAMLSLPHTTTPFTSHDTVHGITHTGGTKTCSASAVTDDQLASGGDNHLEQGENC